MYIYIIYLFKQLLFFCYLLIIVLTQLFSYHLNQAIIHLLIKLKSQSEIVSQSLRVIIFMNSNPTGPNVK